MGQQWNCDYKFTHATQYICSGGPEHMGKGYQARIEISYTSQEDFEPGMKMSIEKNRGQSQKFEVLLISTW